MDIRREKGGEGGGERCRGGKDDGGKSARERSLSPKFILYLI